MVPPPPLSRTNVNVRDETSNLFPKKRELEKKIEALESEIIKGKYNVISFSFHN